MKHMAAIIKVFITLSGVTFIAASFRRCKWSNEDCGSDSECCSKDCYRAHEGTDPRCSRGRVGMPCFADYQCENGYACGRKSECCSPYWGVCTKHYQCCDPVHVCRPENGFTYRRCLYPGKATRVMSLPHFTLFLSCLLSFIFIWILPKFIYNK